MIQMIQDNSVAQNEHLGHQYIQVGRRRFFDIALIAQEFAKLGESINAITK